MSKKLMALLMAALMLLSVAAACGKEPAPTPVEEAAPAEEAAPIEEAVLEEAAAQEETAPAEEVVTEASAE